MQKTIKNKMKAIGLVEVLIAIAISALLMVASVSVSVRALSVVRESELSDLASGILIRSLEISRSPLDFELSKKVATGSSANFSLSYDQSTNSFQLVSANFLPQINSCPVSGPGSEYLVQIGVGGVENVDLAVNRVCNQIIISDLNVGASGPRRTFQIKSIVVYEYLDKKVFQELISYTTEFAAQ